MLLGMLRQLGLAVAFSVLVVTLAAPSGAAVRSGSAPTFAGSFEFEGIAAVRAGKGCRGEGAFGDMRPGARVLISERVTSGDFEKLATGKLRRGKAVDVEGDEVCRMRFKAKAATAPAADSTIYLEIKGVTFDVSWPAADVADGDLGIWTCEYSDNSCATVVGRD